MRMKSTVQSLSLLAMLVAATACGGGGSGGGGTTPSIGLSSTLLPLLSSGQSLPSGGYELPLTGGCGGPYVVRLISGNLPDGVSIDDRQANLEGPGNPATHRHHLVGSALEDGAFAFRLEILDRGCRPAVSTTADFSWTVTRGSVAILGATPAIVPVAQYNDPLKYTDVDALQKTVYGTFTSINFVVAGGVGPYVCAVIDDPADANDDDGLPFGVVMPPASCSLVGSPQQVGNGGRPFRFTLRATDSVGQSAVRKFQWKIDTPPMIVGSADITDGVAGAPYGDAIQIVDGVPPFKFELTSDLPTDLDNVGPGWTYSPPAAPLFPSVSGFTVATTGEASNKLTAASYPAPAALGPYYPAPPEGLFITEDGGQAGAISGVPRRYGSFTINVHAYSSTVPNERGQHAFAQYQFDIASGVPLVMVDSFLVDGNGSNSFLANTPDGVGTLPEFEVQQPRTTQMVAQGGVPFDGWTDAPHKNQRALDLGEVAGTYDWSIVTWDSRSQGWHPSSSPAGRPTGIDFTITGRIYTTNNGTDLIRQGRQVIQVAVADRRLPSPQVDTNEMALSIGPDVVILTESRQSSVIITGSQYDSTLHNDSMFIKKLQIVNNVAQRSPLDDTDMAATQIVPPAANLNALTNPLGRLLSGVGKASYTGTGRDAGGADLMRCYVNATGWWNDSFQLNPKGARAFQHADGGKAYYEYYANEYYCYSPNPETTAVALPDIVDGSVSADLGQGVYTDGGKLYPFENDTHFGVFVVRNDGKIYVPFALQKGTYQGFGDYGLASLQGTGAGAPTFSAMRMTHMGVSPNGRFAAMKVMANPANLYELTSQSAIVLMDLSGAKPFAGLNYRIVTMPITSRYLMADSITLTNSHLYVLGNVNNPAYLYGWLQHNVFREPILTGTGVAQYAPGLPSNSSVSYMSLPYHTYGTSYYSGTWNGTTVYTNYYAYHSAAGANRHEDEAAPIPFRVSADGSTCALIAGAYNGAVAGSTAFSFHAYVDKNGAGFQQISSTARKAVYGGARAHRVRFGNTYYSYGGMAQWGKHEGPSGGLEISDDGNRVAYTYSTAPSLNQSYYYSSYQTYYNLEWLTYRMDVVSLSTTNSWASVTEQAVTSAYFGGSHYWRFGGLSFSRDGNRLFFFGGKSLLDGNGTNDYAYWTTSVYNASCWVGGTYYMYDYTNPTQVRSLMPTDAGGTGSNTYTSSSAFNPTAGTNSTNWGTITPMGGFWSQDGRFLYVCAGHPIESSNSTCYRLVGINTMTTTINGKAPTSGFALASWPSQRGMFGQYSNPGMYYGGMLSYLGPSAADLARIKMAKDTGIVFFATHSARYTTGTSTSYGFAYTIAYNSSYMKDAGHIECFSSNVGGAIQRLTSFPNDGTLTAPRGRGIHFIEPTDAGDRLIFVYDIGSSGSTSEYLANPSTEGIGYVASIQLNPTTGALVNRVQTQLEGSEGTLTGQVGTAQGRAGSSVAFGTDGQRVYYSFGPSASDENARTIAAPRIDGSGNVGSGTTTRYGTGSRDNILHAGR